MYIYIYLENRNPYLHASNRRVNTSRTRCDSYHRMVYQLLRNRAWRCGTHEGEEVAAQEGDSLRIPARVCECGCVRARCISRDALSCAFLRFFLLRACTWAFSSSPSLLGYGYTYTRTLAFSLSLPLSPLSCLFSSSDAFTPAGSLTRVRARVEAVPPVRRAPRCCRLVVPLLFDEYLVSELQLSVVQRFSTASYGNADGRWARSRWSLNALCVKRWIYS